MDTLSLIAEALAPLVGKQVLDVGCGAGALARALTKRGAQVTGIDPQADAVQAARAASPESVFQQCETGALPFAPGTFNGAVMLNSLHHVAPGRMQAALTDVLRVLDRAARLIVIEPLPSGSLFTVLLHVEDETDIRSMAQDAVKACVEAGACTLLQQVDYERVDTVDSFEQLMQRFVAADPARSAAVRDHSAEIEAAYLHHCELRTDGRAVLRQPLRAQVLGKRA